MTLMRSLIRASSFKSWSSFKELLGLVFGGLPLPFGTILAGSAR